MCPCATKHDFFLSLKISELRIIINNYFADYLFYLRTVVDTHTNARRGGQKKAPGAEPCLDTAFTVCSEFLSS